jgi:hypothetical protein
MLPLHFAESNKVYKAPKDWDESIHGPCADLHTLEQNGTISSIWKPTEEELAILVAGGAIVLTLTSQYQPPVRLWTTPIEPIEDEPAVAVEDEVEEVSETVEDPHPEVHDFPSETGPLSAEEEHDTIEEAVRKTTARLN